MLDRTHVILAAALALAATASCTKTEGTSSETTTGAASATPSAAATAAASGAASAASAAASASAAPAESAAAAASASGAAPAASGSGAAAASAAPAKSAAPAGEDLKALNAACGTKPQPDCPLQAWMKQNTNPPIAANDLPALATALDKVVTLAPPGYPNWVSIAKDGAKAARGGDMTAAKASCRTCHDQYKKQYKAELRGRKI